MPIARSRIAHYDGDVSQFAQRYFAATDRKCLLVAGAGFDPRSLTISKMLASTLNTRLRAVFVREHRPSPLQELVKKADEHAGILSKLVENSRAADIRILSDEDRAVIGGHYAVQDVARESLEGITDVVLDMSALSIGVSFPIAKYFYDTCRNDNPQRNFHIVVASDPQLEAAISGVPNDAVDPVRGFSGRIDLQESENEPKIWLPHLSFGRGSTLQLIKSKLRGPVDVCPVLPLSQRDPRVGDKLIENFESELSGEWDVDPRNLVYAIEDDPLDLYWTISAIYRRYKQAFAGVTECHVVLSPSGSKVLALGALMAALEHDLPVRYVEAVGYELDQRIRDTETASSRLVHVWLCGAPYEVEKPGQEAAGRKSSS